MSKLVCVVFHVIVLKPKENTDILIKQINHNRSIFHVIFGIQIIADNITCTDV